MIKYKKKWLLLAAQLIIALLLAYALPYSQGSLALYDRYIFYPFQSFRGMLLGWQYFSVGDFLYIVAGIRVLITLIKWVRYLIKFKSHKFQLLSSVLYTANIAVFIYIFFMIGWGINYNRLPLRTSWNFDRDFTFRKDSAALISFDQFLIDKLNATAPSYHIYSFSTINRISEQNYKNYTDSKVRMHGLGIKPSLFSMFMERTAIEGYYNPFTGEGQADNTLPAFLLPYIVSHEMAHQAGIAAEGDANLMAYAICTMCPDTTFQYSGYLGLWQYVNTRLFFKDSALAKSMAAGLNKLTLAHIDTIEVLSRKYDNDVSRYSSIVYDSYLKMQNQKDGIRSYGSVTANAYLLEQRRKTNTERAIHIP